MPTRPCPNCERVGPRHLAESSKDGSVDYYRCDCCGHVWSVAKDATKRVRHVTPLAEPPPNSEHS
jgi:hypothetical protein